MNGLGYAWKALERCFSSDVIEKISWMMFCADKMVNLLVVFAFIIIVIIIIVIIIIVNIFNVA